MPRPWCNSAWSRTVGGVLATLTLWPLAAGATVRPGPVGGHARLDPARLARFETSLEDLRRQLEIPGLSAAIVSDGRLSWARGFGLADVRHHVEAEPSTPYHLASVTKPFAAVLVLQLAQEGVLGLDDPVSAHGLSYEGPGVVRVRHLLSHTSRGEPGTEFRYDSERFADLGWVLARASGRSFRQLLVERVLTPLGMDDTAPTPLSMGDGVLRPFQVWLSPRNTSVYRRLARAYALDRSFSVVDGDHPAVFSPASGLVSSASDLARFDVALDSGRLLSEAARARMFAPTVAADGRALPYGLGWFSQTHSGTRLVWHYGWNPPTASALYLKLPDEGLTFIALANTDALSRPFELGRSDGLVLDCLVALLFYETFVVEPRRDRPMTPVDWSEGEELLLARLRRADDVATRELWERELLARRRVFHAMGRADEAERLGRVYTRLPGREGRELLPLGESLLPWPSVPLFGMGHVAAMLWFLVVGVSTVGGWAVRAARSRRARWSGPGTGRSLRVRVTALFAEVTILTGAALYVAILAGWPGEGAVVWSGGGALARGLIVVSAASGALGAVVAIRSLTSWPARSQSTPRRLARLLEASGVGAGAWALLDLAGWL